MERLPAAITKLINFFERLPGIGPKTAARLAFYLIQTPTSFVEDFSGALVNIKREVSLCRTCFNIDDVSPCRICSDHARNRELLCVVEKPLDVLAIENTGNYQGLYHVLGGVINPLSHIGPDQLKISELLNRLSEADTIIKEVILATNPTMEGEATALYLKREISKVAPKVKVSRIGHGLPLGADVDYADPGTLTEALRGRQDF